jgi:quercetin 2,3-dioxygenase
MEQIYLSEQRGQTQNNGFRSLNTFNFGAYQQDSRQSFGALYVLNDDTLAGGHKLKMNVEADSYIILLPIVGAIAYKNSLDTEGGYLSAGQVQIFSAAKGMSFEIENPYETELINVLQIWIKRTSKNFESSIKNLQFDLLEQKNSLIPFYTEGGTSCYIGQFDGRVDAVFNIKKTRNGIFAFVIKGAFEVQNRLLETRDGLSLLNVKEVEFEALSNNAIILFLEISQK